MITHVSFDADDTLWEFDRVMRAALERALQDLYDAHLDLPAARALTLEDLIRVRERIDEQDGAAEVSLRERRVMAFAATLEQLGRPDAAFAELLTQRFMDGRSSLVEPYPDVLPMLARLDGRYVLGIVSNGNADLEAGALRGRFTFRVHADEHGVAKPDPRLFEVVFAQTGCRPEQLVHVGDDPFFDVAGAQAAGVHAVWLNRHGSASESGIQPDSEITTLAELPALLEGLA
jgi:putative hydrolase of the HAD superfamily